MALELRIENGLANIPFISLLGEYARGKITGDAVKTHINEAFVDGGLPVLTADEITNVDQHLSELDALATLAEKNIYLLGLFNVLNLAEYDANTLYSNKADVKTRLGYSV